MRLQSDWIKAPEAQAVCKMLESAGHAVYFVGGCVRDGLLGRAVADLDLATSAKPEQVIDLAQGAGFHTVPTGLDHGTVTVVADHVPFEITTFRRDEQTFGRHAKVAFSDDITEDARRRDFTMNALYARADGLVVDPLRGLPDLQARRVRFIEDPVQRIREDYLRSLRFFRFFAWYGDPSQGVDADGLAAVASNLDGLADLSRERVGGEIIKLLSAPNPALAVAAMRQSGVLTAVVPGADDTHLAPLIHHENEAHIPPVAIRRLAVMGGNNPKMHLRLSNQHAKQLQLIHDEVGTLKGPAELGYRHGVAQAVDIVLVRAALLENVPPTGFAQAAQDGAKMVFPIKAADLMPALAGPELGQKLQALETQWIASGFTLSRDDLLGGAGE